ncbi:MAG: DUF6644 family protein [Alphaproteobacteria bacterium]
MDFSKLFPGAQPWVESLPKAWPFVYMQDIYAPFGALHLVGLALLGGCVLLLNLRLLGAGITDEPPSVIEKNLRPWLILGACIVIGTGLIIGALNSSKLYFSPAFFCKMVALAAALAFTFGVSNSVAKSEGEVSTTAKIIAAVAGLVWLFALGVFGTAQGVNPGAVHMIEAGYAILVIFGTRTRWIGVAAISLLLVGDFLMYFIVGLDNQDQIWLDVSKYATMAAAALLVGLLGFEVFTGKAQPASPLARIIALFSILSWVTVAAAGRWIGLS